MADFRSATKNTDLTQLFLVALIAFFGFKLYKKIAPTSSGAQGFGDQNVSDDNSLAGNSTTQNETKAQLKAWIDDVVTNLNGVNWFGAYPEIVNRGANMSKNELIYALNYYNAHYKNTIGGNPKFYDFINDEWASVGVPYMSSYYDPLLNHLTALNLRNY